MFGAVANVVSSSEESQFSEPKLKISSLKSPKNGDCGGADKGNEEFL